MEQQKRGAERNNLVPINFKVVLSDLKQRLIAVQNC